MDKLQKAFYIGSCRYQPMFKKLFPPRLHSTSEIINFLKNYKTIDINQDGINMLWGDIAHPGVVAQSKVFLDNIDTAFDGIDSMVLEVCTRKVCMYNQTPLSAFYVHAYRAYQAEQEFIILTDSELRSHLEFIKKHIAQEHGIQKLAVLPHVNLPSRGSDDLIPERASLCVALETACADLDITYVDPAKIYSLKNGTIPYLETILPDMIHYETDESVEPILEYLRDLGWE